MEEVAPHSLDVCVWSSYLHSESVANHWIVQRQDVLARQPHADSLSRSWGSASVFAPRDRLKRCSRSRSEHYAFGLQAAMGRAVMVGRGPTGAGVLVLSILIILTAEGCRAQKGWCHTAAVTTGGAERNRSDMRPCWFKVWTRPFVCLELILKDGTLLLSAELKPALHGRVYVEFRLVYAACRRPSWCVWGKTGVVEPGEPVLKGEL